MRKLIFIYAGLLSCLTSVAQAAEETEFFCKVDESAYLPVVDNPEQQPTTVDSDNAQIVQQGTSVFTGNVNVLRGNEAVDANRATYNRQTGDVTAQGDVRVRDSGIIIDAEQAEFSMNADQMRMIEAEYRLREMRARGESSHVFRQGNLFTNLKNATYTTCPEGDNAWRLDADRVHLDHESAVGEAEDVVIRIKDFPVFYTPYINFPLNDERKSGFLLPSGGSSDKTGFDLSTPYYWNISPNTDATITPRYMSDRGLQLTGEYRYLTENNEGLFDAGFLGSDSLRRYDSDQINPNYEEDRKHFTWQHQGRFASNWRTLVDYNYVSDKRYIEDFSSNLTLSSVSNLQRLAQANYYGEFWNFQARVQGYQSLLESVADPYQRLPQLRFDAKLPDQALGLTYEMESEFVSFASDDRVEGDRFDIEPAISLPMGTAAFYATPKIALKHTTYNLDQNQNQPQFQEDSISRTMPIASFDTGVVFERPLNFNDGGMIQTLEPRAYYLYIPHRDQDDIPRFDTAARTFSMSSLFSPNRFNGEDRIGDANQLTLALTSRFINESTGRERLRMTLGQIQYFSDREVTQNPNDPVRTDDESDMIAEVVASITDEWSLGSQFQWDPDETKSNMSALALRYRGKDGRIFNLSHRYRRGDPDFRNGRGLEQLDISASLPINDRWSFVGRYYRSLEANRTLEALAGLEYQNCCWATRVVARNYISRLDEDRNMAIYVEVELKGLGRFGKKSDTLLERSIVGYGANRGVSDHDVGMY